MKSIALMVSFLVVGNFCFGQSQSEMNEDAHAAFLKADAELNLVYQQILKEYAEEKTFIANIKKAQRLWVQLRDAEMDAQFPQDENTHYGSVFSMCWSNYLTALTVERTKKLKLWIEGVEEGDVCAGSVKLK